MAPAKKNAIAAPRRARKSAATKQNQPAKRKKSEADDNKPVKIFFPPKAEKKENDEKPKLRIRVRAYDHKILDLSIKQIVDTILRSGTEMQGPIPLPTEVRRYTVNRSSFVHKNAREQFEMRIHKRLIDILNPGPKIIDALTNLNLPAGVDIEVKMS